MAEAKLQVHSDTISGLSFSPNDDSVLVSSSWDSTLYVHNVTDPAKPASHKLAMEGAVLDVSWGSSSNKVYTAELDKSVKEVDVQTGAMRMLATHDEPVKCVEWSTELNAVLSASWDKTLRLTSPSGPPASASLRVPVSDKVYALAQAQHRIVAAMANRQVWIWDARMLSSALDKRSHDEDTAGTKPEQRRESSLKFMTRSLKCMPNSLGYATTSIEGRVAVDFFDPSPAQQEKKYAFKCHRQVVDGVDTVFPVLGLAFHPLHGTFATGGGDGTVSLWDPFAKKRLRQFPKYPAPVSSLEFSKDTGRWFAVAFSEDESLGRDRGGGHGIWLRECGDECKPKSK